MDEIVKQIYQEYYRWTTERDPSLGLCSGDAYKVLHIILGLKQPRFRI